MGSDWVGSAKRIQRPPGLICRSAIHRHARARLRVCPFRSVPVDRQRGIPFGRRTARMRRYELMLVIRPDVADDKSQALVDRTTRGIVSAGGQIVKVAPWGRRRLAYPIDRHREGSYHIVLFEAPSEAISELEHSLLITEEVLRHLVTRADRPTKPGRADDAEGDIDVDDESMLPSGEDEEDEDEDAPELIDESES